VIHKTLDEVAEVLARLPRRRTVDKVFVVVSAPLEPAVPEAFDFDLPTERAPALPSNPIDDRSGGTGLR